MQVPNAVHVPGIGTPPEDLGVDEAPYHDRVQWNDREIPQPFDLGTLE